jgi:hypothetical protein
MKYLTLHKWHVWLGWLVGFPLILWTASGLFMVARPIEEVRGEHLRAKPEPIAAIVPKAPFLGGRAVEKLTLEQRADGPVWLIRYKDGAERSADPATGKLLPKPGAADVRALAEGYYAGDSTIKSIQLFPADREPLELRRGHSAWQVALCRRHQSLYRCRKRQPSGSPHAAMALVRFHVGAAHHGSADARRYQPPDPDRLCQPVAAESADGVLAADCPPAQKIRNGERKNKRPRRGFPVAGEAAAGFGSLKACCLGKNEAEPIAPCPPQRLVFYNDLTVRQSESLARRTDSRHATGFKREYLQKYR